MIEWLQSNETVIWWLVASSVFTFIISLILMPMIVVRIPADYFSHKKRHHKRPEKYPPAVRIVILIMKNVMGVVLLLAGILMLVLPGQGTVTILVGLARIITDLEPVPITNKTYVSLFGAGDFGPIPSLLAWTFIF